MASDRPDGEKPEGFSKYLKRMKTVLRPRSTSKRQSLVAPEAAGPVETKTAPPPAPVPEATPAMESIEPEGPEPVLMPDYSTTQHARTSALFTKYGLNLDPSAWKTPTDLQLTRVAKPIRMRVRRTCHRCETTFGAEKVCINCSHTRCTKCPRFPLARSEDEREQHVRKPKLHELCASHPRALQMTPHLKYTGNPADPLAKLSQTGGKDLVRSPVRQRVHRNCHLCTRQFASGSKECECGHVRCKKCPRDPAKLDKHPDGYPGDVEPPKALPDRTFRKPRRRVHYLCHLCETSYLDGVDTCSKCGQVKCALTIRIPPKKLKRGPDPDIIRSVEEKLANMAIRVEPAATGSET